MLGCTRWQADRPTFEHSILNYCAVLLCLEWGWPLLILQLIIHAMTGVACGTENLKHIPPPSIPRRWDMLALYRFDGLWEPSFLLFRTPVLLTCLSQLEQVIAWSGIAVVGVQWLQTDAPSSLCYKETSIHYRLTCNQGAVGDQPWRMCSHGTCAAAPFWLS